MLTVFCNVEVSQLIDVPVLVGRHDSEPVPDVVLFQKLFRQVLEVSARGDRSAFSIHQ